MDESARQDFTEFVATKHGLAAALHSGDPAFNALPGYFHDRLGPALQTLLENAEMAGAVRGGVDALDLLGAGIASSLHAGNQSALGALIDSDSRSALAALLIDPQTAGGLLLSISASASDRFLRAFQERGGDAKLVGQVLPQTDPLIMVV